MCFFDVFCENCCCFVCILYRLCIPSPVWVYVCVYFVVSVCIVYSVSRFGVFVQCVLCVLCTLCPVLACLYSVYCGQCVQIPYFTVCSASRMSYLLRCPDWGVLKVHIVHTPVLACLYVSPFWRVCTVCVYCVVLCVYCVVLCVYCVVLCEYCVVLCVFVYILWFCVYIVWFCVYIVCIVCIL